ncbi:hypothetical protein AB0G54_12870 [Streptomyces yokosukanensis]|uniref:hypothetical protein n=1 Tax=Streptomyces yokosukanensis TaxID=67386 RepID=UPI00344A13AA
MATMEFRNADATPPITARGRAETARFFDGPELAEPVPVLCSQWRAGQASAAAVPRFGAVSVKP